MPIAAYKELVAFKLETIVGTPEVLADANVIKVTKVDVKPNLELVERHYTDDAFTRLAHIVAGKIGSITFSVDLRGNGNLITPGAADWATLLRACGWKSTDGLAYILTSTVSDYQTATIGVFHEGNIKTLSGAMGSWKITGGAGKLGEVEFTFTGIWQTPVAAGLLNIPADIIPPLCNGGSFTWGGTPRAISQFSLDGGVSVKMLQDMAAAAKYYRAWIDGRKVTGNADPEMVTGVGLWGDYTAGTERAFALSIGLTAGNRIAIAAAANQITQLADGVRDGVRIHNIDFAANGISPLAITWS